MMSTPADVSEHGVFEAWESPGFQDVLRQLLEQQALDLFGIERATSHGGRLVPEDISVGMLRMEDDGQARRLKVAVFFTERVGGCNCADDPFTVNGYCERWVTLERAAHRIQVSDVD